MALINCYECDKQISDKANSCPSCGAPVNSVRVNETYIVNSRVGKSSIVIGYTLIISSLIYLYGEVYKFFIVSIIIGIVLVIAGKIHHWWHWE